MMLIKTLAAAVIVVAVVVEQGARGSWIDELAILEGLVEFGIRRDEYARLDELERSRPLGEYFVEVINEAGPLELVVLGLD